MSKLIKEFQDKAYRHASVASHITNRIAFQIRALREQRQWNQERLAQEAGMKQERISVLENPNHSSVNIETLKRLARAFDVALIVGFVPFSHLAKWELDLSSNSLEVPSFDQEPYFKELPTEELTTQPMTYAATYAAVTEGITSYNAITIPWNLPPGTLLISQQNPQGIAAFNPTAGGTVRLEVGRGATVLPFGRKEQAAAPGQGCQAESNFMKEPPDAFKRGML
jgi:transcriptional regulator with XRE-family HTH domain